MKGYIGVTDNDWFAFLSQHPEIDEVNFWQPGGTGRFRALDPGEPFFFKLQVPHQHYIAGVGFFAYRKEGSCLHSSHRYFLLSRMKTWPHYLF